MLHSHRGRDGAGRPMVKIPGEESFGGTVAGVGGVFSLLQKFFIGGIYICIQERHSKRTEILVALVFQKDAL